MPKLGKEGWILQLDGFCDILEKGGKQLDIGKINTAFREFPELKQEYPILVYFARKYGNK